MNKSVDKSASGDSSADHSPERRLDRTGEFFNVGSPLHAVRPGYIRRAADDTLTNTVIEGHYAHLIAPDRSGKTSLIASTSARLQANGFKVAILDLAQISERDGGADAGRWYYSIVYRLSRQLRLKTDIQTWWQDHSILSHRQRLVEFFAQVVLQHIPDRIVVFVDEIQVIQRLGFPEELLASIRAAHNSRTTEPEFSRLSFVLIGECDPRTLDLPSHSSPFDVSRPIAVDDFSREDLSIFAAELNLPAADAEVALDRVFSWTSGQPYLSQKLARAVAREEFSGSDIDEHVDRIAFAQLAGRAALSSEPHLNHLHRQVVDDVQDSEGVLTLYGKVRKGLAIDYDPASRLQRKLKASGLLTKNANGKLKVKNRVYREVFTARWANEHLPLHWRGPAIAALVILALTAIPFAYTQLLPKPYIKVMMNEEYDLETISNAYQNLRSFPGHTNSADRVFFSVLDSRSVRSIDGAEVSRLARAATLLPDGQKAGDDLVAEFWDRQTQTAMREERRDDALIASLQALQVADIPRRRRVAALLGNDYPQLLGTVSVPISDSLVLNADDTRLSSLDGSVVNNWKLEGGTPQPAEPFSLTALEVTPMVRRIVDGRNGNAGRIGLTINVSHARLDDLRVKLIAPSGRTADIGFDVSASAANEEIRIDSAQLAPLRGEPLNGTWSLSIRDEETGVAGHLHSWNLSLNSQVLVENFDRGVNIPDPVARESENLWFSANGRYAIARALQSDSARLWDLNYAEATRTIAVPAADVVIGLSAGAQFLLTLAQSEVNLWRTSDGRLASALPIDSAVADAQIADDGEHLLVVFREELDTRLEVWSISEQAMVAAMTLAGTPAMIAADASANFIAVADFDRAVRIWRLADEELVTQVDLPAQPEDILLSKNGESLGVQFAESGVTLWSVSEPEVPTVAEHGEGRWSMSFSPSGERFVVGNQFTGVQLYQTVSGLPTGPRLDPGSAQNPEMVVGISRDESVLVTASSSALDKGTARFWSIPTVIPDARDAAHASVVAFGRSGDGNNVTSSAISSDATLIATGDRQGHVHISQFDTSGPVLSTNDSSDEVNYLGHRGVVTNTIFSDDSALVVSAGSDGTVRVWDVVSGQPRPFYGHLPMSAVDKMVLSPSGAQLAVLSGQRVWVMSTENGQQLASVELGELYHDLAFGADNLLYLAADNGALRSYTGGRTPIWQMGTVWQGPAPISHLAVARDRQRIVVVDTARNARLIDPLGGNLGDVVLQLPSPVTSLAFSPTETRVLFQTGPWIHRALVSPSGLVWSDSVPAPVAEPGSELLFGSSSAMVDNLVLVPTWQTGRTTLAVVTFDYSSGQAVVGSRPELLSRWTEQVRGSAISDFVREGF